MFGEILSLSLVEVKRVCIWNAPLSPSFTNMTSGKGKEINEEKAIKKKEKKALRQKKREKRENGNVCMYFFFTLNINVFPLFLFNLFCFDPPFFCFLWFVCNTLIFAVSFFPCDARVCTCEKGWDDIKDKHVCHSLSLSHSLGRENRKFLIYSFLLQLLFCPVLLGYL